MKRRILLDLVLNNAIEGEKVKERSFSTNGTFCQKNKCHVFSMNDGFAC